MVSLTMAILIVFVVGYVLSLCVLKEYGMMVSMYKNLSNVVYQKSKQESNLS